MPALRFRVNADSFLSVTLTSTRMKSRLCQATATSVGRQFIYSTSALATPGISTSVLHCRETPGGVHLGLFDLVIMPFHQLTGFSFPINWFS